MKTDALKAVAGLSVYVAIGILTPKVALAALGIVASTVAVAQTVRLTRRYC